MCLLHQYEKMICRLSRCYIYLKASYLFASNSNFIDGWSRNKRLITRSRPIYDGKSGWYWKMRAGSLWWWKNITSRYRRHSKPVKTHSTVNEEAPLPCCSIVSLPKSYIRFYWFETGPVTNIFISVSSGYVTFMIVLYLYFFRLFTYIIHARKYKKMFFVRKRVWIKW